MWAIAPDVINTRPRLFERSRCVERKVDSNSALPEYSGH
jgi:hypothetical protein